jgi:hypothetical protein
LYAVCRHRRPDRSPPEAGARAFRVEPCGSTAEDRDRERPGIVVPLEAHGARGGEANAVLGQLAPLAEAEQQHAPGATRGGIEPRGLEETPAKAAARDRRVPRGAAWRDLTIRQGSPALSAMRAFELTDHHDTSRPSGDVAPADHHLHDESSCQSRTSA